MKELTTMYDMAFDVIFIQFEKSVGKMEICYLLAITREFLKLPRQTY